MSRCKINNRKRQEDEVLAISNIYSNNEFSYSKEDIIHCYYNVFVNDSGDLLKLENVHEQNYFIKYLPSIRMYLQLNVDYPNERSPNFYIISSWLSPWQISFICQKLDEIWLENRGQEILFLWFKFLRDDVLKCLNIKDTLDISFMYMTYHNVLDYFKLNSIFQNDIRAIYSILHYDPLQFLLSYNKYTEEIKFQNSYFECIICFDKFFGRQCIKLKNCGHIYCNNCMQEYIIIKIKKDNVTGITCPDLSCNLDITINEIKRICPELFSQYEKALLRVTLSTMKDVIFCPKISYQCPFVKTYDDTLGICSKCDYTFCTYCYKIYDFVYHGVEPCAMSLSGRLKLIEEYQNGSKHEKKQLEAKYGRRQIQRVAEEHLTREYLKKYTKACPNCATMVGKIDGCNKMKCNYCQAYFCWLCGVHITTNNPYDHFLSRNNNCYLRFFLEERNIVL